MIEYKSLVGEIQAKYHPKTINKAKINTSSDACSFIRTLWSDDIEYLEECFVMPLNRANNILGYIKLSKGGSVGTIIDIKTLMQILLVCNAHGFIIFHNHPSGNLKPSQSDIDITKKIKLAANILEISFMDHCIITKESYYSFADEGLI